MEIPRDAVVDMVGGRLSMLTLCVKSTRFGLPSWHLSPDSSRDLHPPLAGVKAALYLPKRSKFPNKTSEWWTYRRK